MTNGFPFRLSSVPLRFRFHFVLSPIRFLLLFCSIANTAGPVGGGDRERERERVGEWEACLLLYASAFDLAEV